MAGTESFKGTGERHTERNALGGRNADPVKGPAVGTMPHDDNYTNMIPYGHPLFEQTIAFGCKNSGGCRTADRAA